MYIFQRPGCDACTVDIYEIWTACSQMYKMVERGEVGLKEVLLAIGYFYACLLTAF